MKHLYNYHTGQHIVSLQMNYSELYDYLKNNMPYKYKDRVLVDTGKKKRVYFWHDAGEYLGMKLTWNELP